MSVRTEGLSPRTLFFLHGEEGILVLRLAKYFKKYTIFTILCPLFVSAEVLIDIWIPVVMSRIIDTGINGPNGSDIRYVINNGLIMIGLATLSMICGMLSGVFSSRASTGLVRNIRTAMFNKIQDYSFANRDKFTTASLVTRLTADNVNVRMAYMMGLRILVRAPILLISSTIMTFRINSSLSSVFLVAIPVLAVGLFLVFRSSHPRFLLMMKKMDTLNLNLQENLTGIRVVKTFVRAEYEKEKFNRSANDVRNNSLNAQRLLSLNDPLFQLTVYGCMIAISWFGGKMMIGGNLTTGEFMSYLAYIRQILFSLMMLSQILMQSLIAQISAERIIEVLDEEIDIKDLSTDPDLVLDDGTIKFEKTSFSYSKRTDNLVLQDINIDIGSGQTVGIIGGTGSGKSSLVQLIPRLYEVTSGSIIVGGHDVKEYPLDTLRKDVAMVLQDNVLFSGTIMENLRWGDENAADEEVYEACRHAQADSFVRELPLGYQTLLGQGGVNLSGGQQQRLCIARALLKHPKIIILDDSTSAVDTDTDSRIRKALKESLSNMTTIIIAQRIVSVIDADLIVVMDDGKIVDTGTHQQLLEGNDIYRELYTTQLQGVV